MNGRTVLLITSLVLSIQSRSYSWCRSCVYWHPCSISMCKFVASPAEQFPTDLGDLDNWQPSSSLFPFTLSVKLVVETEIAHIACEIWWCHGETCTSLPTTMPRTAETASFRVISFLFLQNAQILIGMTSSIILWSVSRIPRRLWPSTKM